MLDTDVLVDLLRDFPPAVQWLATIEDALTVGGFAAMELIKGCRSAADVHLVNALLKSFPIRWPTSVACEDARRAFPERHLRSGLGILDALIAACALAHDATLCTFNQKHYREIAGLRIEQPYERGGAINPQPT